ncbi:MAG: ABC transporter ATP-binding protein [Betaproteobacteria bacterium]|nr:ABC transporter ATP-binding protein [Betaproteobacteria bacterium]NDA23524.1 ABC transporter ATP-binding protein [Betaproteobacteria bacterium]NDA33409.1 ABC transporter ATP-binding protein [Betaproteobacteria bacterium]NDA55201.1 ABC transporter ATP-binding protein [Betaproteobacteria bacterium]NDD77414.1 ABC transporter ATP-binding protein [Betaproteobacteria bacterium]
MHKNPSEQGHPAIRLTGVSKTYGSLRALDGISLSIAQGEFFGLLGPNGAGKTSLISIIAGLNRPSEGSVEVMGLDVLAEPERARRQLGVVPQELVFDPFFTVRETLELTAGYYGVKANTDWIDQLLQQLDLSQKASANMRALSGGMKRRVLVAQALVHRPAVIVLDEPTAGVDVELRQSLWRFIGQLNQQGHTILLTTHYLEEAQAMCSRIAMLKQGRIVALDQTAKLLARYEGGVLLAQYRDGSQERLPFAHYFDLEALIATMRQSGRTIDALQIEGSSLEDVFLDIMQESGIPTFVAAEQALSTGELTAPQAAAQSQAKLSSRV